MSKRLNLINNIIYMALTLALFFVVLMVCNAKYSVIIADTIGFYAIGIVVAGFICTLFHELSHLISGKINGFAFISISVWFFSWTKVKNKIKFSFIFPKESAGQTTMVAKHTENLALRFKKMTLAGFVSTIFLTLIGTIVFIIQMPMWLYCIFSMFLPIGAYCLFGNALPMQNNGVKNDGAVLLDIKKNNNSFIVLNSILSIQSELYNGKTPGEIDSKLYFDLPQLPEDDINFALLLDARYYYYLDIKDYDNAQKCSDRLLSLEEYLPNEYMVIFKTNALYNACTFNFNEELADDLMYELDKYLNNVNTATNIRVKMAYLKYVAKDLELIESFYKKGIKESRKENLLGLSKFENKLIEQLYNDN